MKISIKRAQSKRGFFTLSSVRNLHEVNKIFQYILMTVSMVAMASCTQDEVLTPSAEVQDIRIVVGDFPAFDDAQTRAIGTFDSGKTAWEPNDVIYIVAANAGVDDQILTLTYGADGQWAADENKIHYLSATDTHIHAIYAPNCKTEGTEITAKDNLPYGTGEFLEKDCNVENNTLTVDFTGYVRSYSRLRIVTEPNKQIAVTATMFAPAGYPDSGTYNYALTADDKGNAYLYGKFAANGTVTVKNGDEELKNYTFAAPTGEAESCVLFAGTTVDLAELTETYIISDDKNYLFQGTGSYGIQVSNGSPTIFLDDANVNVSGIAINVDAQNSNVTILVSGSDNKFSSSTNTAIAVSNGSTLHIVGYGAEDMLTAIGGSNGAYMTDSKAGAGIGSPLDCTVGGNVVIQNLTINATGGGGENGSAGAGIGSSSNGKLGDITIKNAKIIAQGADDAAAIGMGGNYYNRTSPAPSIGNIIIEKSDITAVGGENAAAIGFCRASPNAGVGTYYAGIITITTDTSESLEEFLYKLLVDTQITGTSSQRIGVGAWNSNQSPILKKSDGSASWEGVNFNGTNYPNGIN